MKILIINLDKSIFLPESKSLKNLKDYSQQVEKLFVITWIKGDNSSIVFDDRLFIYPTNSRSRLLYIYDTVKIYIKHLKGKEINIVSSQDPFETGFCAWIISKLFKLALHLQIHTDFLSPYFSKESVANRIRVLVAKFLIKRAEHIRVVSQRIFDSLEKLGLKLKNEPWILPIFVDVESVKNTVLKTSLRKKYPQFDFIILMASRFSKEKNIVMAISVMADIFKEKTKTGLVIVGGGPENTNYKTQIRKHKLENNVIIEEWTDDLPSYYKTADLFLLTSNYEGYGRTLIEAAAAGCKIISSDVGIAEEILEKENIFKVGNEKDLTEKIIAAISGKIKPPKPILPKTREEYLQEYKKIWEEALKKANYIK